MAKSEKERVSSEELSRKLDAIMSRLDSLERVVMKNPDYAELAAFLNLAKAGVGLYKEPLDMLENLKRQSTPHITARLAVGTTLIQAGEDVHLTIELINDGDLEAQILRVEGLLPPTFELVRKPPQTQFENGTLLIKDLKVTPLLPETVRFTVRSFTSGNYRVQPRIVYADRYQTLQFCEPEPRPVRVDITVLPNRTSTGNTKLDSLLFGGLPESYATVLSSDSCDERDLLLRKFLTTGLEKGEMTFYVGVTTKNVADMKDSPNFYLLLCSPQADTIAMSRSNVFTAKGIENLTDINIALTLTFRRIASSRSTPRRACLDLLSDILLQHKAKETRRWLAGVLSEFKSNGFTVLATLNPHMHPFEEAQAILDLFDGEIDIFKAQPKDSDERYLQVKRLHNQTHLETEIRLAKEDLRKPA